MRTVFYVYTLCDELVDLYHYHAPAPPPTTPPYTLYFLSCFDRIMRAKRNGDMSRLRPPEQSKREVSGCVPTLHLYHPTHTHGIMPLHSALTMLRSVMSCVTHTLAHILTSVCAAIYNEWYTYGNMLHTLPAKSCPSIYVNHILLLSSVQKHQQMMRETLEMKEKEEGEEGEVLYMVPVEEREDEGSGGQQELVVLPSGVDAVSSFSSSSTSPSQSNSGSGPRTTNPKLNQLVKGTHIFQ